MNYYNQPQPQFQRQIPQINFNQFQQMAANLPESMLAQLVAQAQLSGIKQQDIENGLNYINSLRNQSPQGV